MQMPPRAAAAGKRWIGGMQLAADQRRVTPVVSDRNRSLRILLASLAWRAVALDSFR
jgi:hypothetical protein